MTDKENQLPPHDGIASLEDAAGEDEPGLFDEELKKESEVAWDVDRQGDKGEQE